MISGGTLQSLAEATGDTNAGRVTDPAALIDGRIARSAGARDSPIRLRPRRGRSRRGGRADGSRLPTSTRR